MKIIIFDTYKILPTKLRIPLTAILSNQSTVTENPVVKGRLLDHFRAQCERVNISPLIVKILAQNRQLTFFVEIRDMAKKIFLMLRLAICIFALLPNCDLPFLRL